MTSLPARQPDALEERLEALIEKASSSLPEGTDIGSADHRYWLNRVHAARFDIVELIPQLLSDRSADRERIEELERTLRFYAENWRSNMQGDGETPGLSACWDEPTDELWHDAGTLARSALQ